MLVQVHALCERHRRDDILGKWNWVFAKIRSLAEGGEVLTPVACVHTSISLRCTQGSEPNCLD